MPRRVVLADDEPLARERLRTLLAEQGGAYELVAECRDGAEAVDAIVELRPEIVLLDIQMPELDGFEVLEALAGDAPPALVFVTAYDEYAVRAFEVHALDYLLKPVEPARFRAALERAERQLAANRSAGGDTEPAVRAVLAQLQANRGYAARFVVRAEGGKLLFVRAAEVDWIDAAGNYARLHAGGKALLLRETMKSLEARLDPAQFLRVHRSAIVNLDRVASLEPYFHGEYIVTLRDGTKLTSSRGYSARLRGIIR